MPALTTLYSILKAVFQFTALEKQATFVKNYLDKVDLDLVRIDTVANLLEMTAWDLTKTFREMERAPCENADPTFQHTLRAGYTALRKYKHPLVVLHKMVIIIART